MNISSSQNGAIDDFQDLSIMERKPIVTYAGDKELFQSLEQTLSSALPQEPTEWRRSYGRAIKSVHVAASFVPFGKDILPKEGDYHLIQQPVFHTYWTQCPDVETYKTTVRENIEAWMKVLGQHNISDWMIVLVETYDFRKTNKLLPRTTVLDKIRSDFGVKHADRCLSVINPLRSESRSAGSWRGLLVNFRLLLLTAFDRTLLRFEEVVRDQREKRNQPGWNFCSYFLLQEELAFVLEMLGVYEEALVQYDELDALFTQFVLNSNLGDTPSWLSGFQGPLESWPGLTLSHTLDKELRQLIQQSNISLLQFRSYLFSRQCTMLLFTFKPWEVAQRCLPFLHNCINELKILEISSPPGAVACWIFLCCLEVLHTCEKFNDSGQVEAYSLYTAGLWAYARDKLAELGELCGLMPGCETTSQQLHTVVLLSAGIGDSPTNSAIYKLKQALSSKDVFKKQYLELSELAMGTYKHIGRARSAWLIGQDLSRFYQRVGDYSSAAMFLASALCNYEDDGWTKLAANTRIELAACYSKMGDNERYAKMCAAIASSVDLDISVRSFYLEEMQRVLKESKHDHPCTTVLSQCFSVQNVDVKVLKKEGYVEAVVIVTSKFPVSVTCSKMQLSVEHIKKEHRNPKKAIKDSKTEVCEDKHQIRNSIEELKPTNPVLLRLNIVETLDYQQDKSLAAANVACPNVKHHLRRQDSQGRSRKPSVATRGDFSRSISAENFQLSSGKNTVVLRAKLEEEGWFRVGQALISLGGLDFVSGTITPRISYEVVGTPITVSLIKGEKDLLAGLPQVLTLTISTGSHYIEQDTYIKLHTTIGLLMQYGEDVQPACRDLEILLFATPPFSTVELPLTVLANLPPQRDNSVIEHTVSLKCPWAEEERPLTLHFQPPFLSVCRLHTACLHKFVHISIVGLNAQLLRLSDPQLNVISPQTAHLTSLNPACGQPMIVGAERRLGFIWELQPSDSPETPPIRTEFTVRYSATDVENTQPSVYKCPFDITNYKTLFIVESRIEPTKGSEFCRASTLCHLHLGVQRVCASPDSSLMYEVLADQTMWAVCGKTAGVISLDTGERQSVLLDVMPLINGYLPLPLVRLSKYIPADIKLSSTRALHADTHPRLEPFSPGQVYNSSKGTQVHVIGAATT